MTSQEMDSHMLLLFLLFVVPTVSQTVCPRGCYCHKQTKFVDCETLMQIPNKFPRDTKEIRMSQLNVRHIPAKSFEDLPDLEIINITNSNIAEIDGCAFVDLSGLKKIYIDKSNINNMHPYAFDGLKNITEFHMEKCNIGRIKPYAFHNIENIKTFTFKNVKVINTFNSLSFNKVSNIHKLSFEDMNINKFSRHALHDVTSVDTFKMFKLNVSNFECQDLAALNTSSESFQFYQNIALCNCSIGWLVNDANGGKYNDFLQFENECNGPEDMVGKSFAELGWKDISCSRKPGQELCTVPDIRKPEHCRSVEKGKWDQMEQDRKNEQNKKNKDKNNGSRTSFNLILLIGLAVLSITSI